MPALAVIQATPHGASSPRSQFPRGKIMFDAIRAAYDRLNAELRRRPAGTRATSCAASTNCSSALVIAAPSVWP